MEISNKIVLYSAFALVAIFIVSAVMGGTITGEAPRRRGGGPPSGGTSTIIISSCYDSDGGVNIYTRGYVSYTFPNNGTTTQTYDYCYTGSNSMSEHYCADGTIKGIFQTCPSGYSCLDGACRLSSTTSTTTTTVGPTCVDTDNGQNIFVNGTVYIIDNSIVVNQYYDYCIQNSPYIVEYYCTGNSTLFGSIQGQCPSGYACSTGACR